MPFTITKKSKPKTLDVNKEKNYEFSLTFDYRNHGKNQLFHHLM